MKQAIWPFGVAIALSCVACEASSGAPATPGTVASDAAAAADAPDGVSELGPPGALEGYLFDQCAWQAYPSLPDIGLGCMLDVFLSPTAATGPLPNVCNSGPDDGQPFTSSCLVDAAGHSIDSTVLVHIDGSYGKTRVCTIATKGVASSCKTGAVFVPTSIRP